MTEMMITNRFGRTPEMARLRFERADVARYDHRLNSARLEEKKINAVAPRKFAP
jgi:hypothetical protein